MFAGVYQYVHIAGLFFMTPPPFFSVSPGNVWTPLWDQLAHASGNFEKSKRDGEEAQVSEGKLLRFYPVLRLQVG